MSGKVVLKYKHHTIYDPKRTQKYNYTMLSSLNTFLKLHTLDMNKHWIQALIGRTRPKCFFTGDLAVVSTTILPRNEEYVQFILYA